MPHHTFVSFEPELIRVLTAKSRGDRVVHALTLSNDEFEQFLQNDRSSDYHIIINSPDAVYDTINIPPVKSNLIRTLVQNETKRLFSTQPEFTTSFRSVDEIFQDNKTMQRIACCMVPDEFLFSILEPFIRHNKRVSSIISAPTVMADLVSATIDTSNETMLCTYDGGQRKTIFLLEKGCVTLVRHVPSDGPGWNSYDIQNISMTQDYCFQSLRVRPSRTVALNGEETEGTLTILETRLSHLYPELYQEYLPLLAAMNLPNISSHDLRPQTYLDDLKQQKILRNIMGAFAGGSALVVLLLLYNLYSVISLNSEIDYVRQQEQTLPIILENYQTVQQQFSVIEPLIALINKVQAEPSLPALLSSMPPAPAGSTNISAIKVRSDKENSIINITGSISEKTFESMQHQFEALLSSLEKVKGITITTKQIDPKEQTFSIEATYKP